GDDEWRASFAEIERVLDRSLPRSARMYRPWWANTKDGGHSQALAWVLAGWTTSQVDLDAEEVTFIRERKDDLMSRDTIERKSAPTMEEFRAALTSEIERAISNDQSIVSINAGELHRKVGGYPTPF